MRRTVVEMLRDNANHASEFASKFDDVQDSQHPAVVTVCCSDSRVLQDHIWGNAEPGRIFTCSNIGNRVVQRTDAGEVVSGDVLYPVEHTGTETIVVVGHTGCGAVTAAYDVLGDGSSDETEDGSSEPAGIDHCIGLLTSRIETGVESLPEDVERAESVNRLVEYNVDRQIEFLLESDDVPSDVDALGVVYDFQDVYSERRGRVHVVNANGETDAEALRDAHPEIAPWVDRLWSY